MKPNNLSRQHEKALQILSQFSHIEAVGLSGSVSRDVNDKLSDIDLCVFVKDQIPSPQERKRQYKIFGISNFKYFDGDLDVSRIDGLNIEGVDYDFLWMSLPKSEEFLKNLTTDFECDENLPGGLLTAQAVYDPQNHIEKLCDAIPCYPEERVKYRLKQNIDQAYFSLNGLAWAKKAPHRHDIFSYFYNSWTVFDSFINALFALNRQWRAHEKRIIQQIQSFKLAPKNTTQRVESIIRFQNENADLKTNVKNIEQLFIDLTVIAQSEYPDLNLPQKWR